MMERLLGLARRFAFTFASVFLMFLACKVLSAKVIEVPGDHASIQAAIEQAAAGDTVLVGPGTYFEHVLLKPGVTLLSKGEDKKGELGLQRAERTIIDGSKQDAGPGLTMAEGATLDGFTITGIGEYDAAKWEEHHATQGENQPHEHIGEPGTAGISIEGVTCTVQNNIVHHIGYTGIAILGVKGGRCSPSVYRNVCYRNMGGGIGSMRGSTALIEENICFENFYAGIGHTGASPIVLNNVCYENIRAGIGVSEGSSPLVRGNQCYKNRRAGIGIRSSKETSPVIESNECYENDMAGIGCEDDATPIIRGNKCHHNAMAGIGSQHRAEPLICDNECDENRMVGIGTREHARPVIYRNSCRKNKLAGIGVEEKAYATILSNLCQENALVAIGVRHESEAVIIGNVLERTTGMPPMIAVRENSKVTVMKNDIRGGGVAGVMVDGQAVIIENEFKGNGPRGGGPPNFAVWVHPGSKVMMDHNQINAWRHAVLSDGAEQVTVSHNVVNQFLKTAIVIKNTVQPAQITGNKAFSDKSTDQVVHIQGAHDPEQRNELEVSEPVEE